jgi:hypothetical protein
MGERKEEYLYIYYDNGIKFCDYCNDIFDRYELVYITPEYYEDPEKMVWTIKLCRECLNVIIIFILYKILTYAIINLILIPF